MFRLFISPLGSRYAAMRGLLGSIALIPTRNVIALRWPRQTSGKSGGRGRVEEREEQRSEEGKESGGKMEGDTIEL